MSRIDDYEKLLADLEESLSRDCEGLRRKLDEVCQDDPGVAMETTQELTEVFRKQAVLKDRGATMRNALEALREMEALKAAILEKVAELGPEYTKYRMARHALGAEGDRQLEELCQEQDQAFRLDYKELEGAVIGPYRALDPDAFAESSAYEEDGSDDVESADSGMAGFDPGPEATAAAAAAAASSPLGATPSLAGATPFSTQDSFEEEAAAPPPQIDEAAVHSLFATEAAERAAPPEEGISALDSVLERSQEAEAAEESAWPADDQDDDEEPQDPDVITRVSGPPDSEVGSMAADLLSMMDDDDVDETPGEVAGEAAASLLAQMEDDESSPPASSTPSADGGTGAGGEDPFGELMEGLAADSKPPPGGVLDDF